jgi:predicted dehydrogenase
MSHRPLRLGMVSVVPHGQPWAEVVAAMTDASITHVWGYPTEPVDAFARRYGITNVCGKPEAMLGEVDAVLMPGGRRMPVDHVEDTVWSLSEPLGRQPSDHARLSQPFLEAGVPVLIDKPLADSMGEARNILAARDRGRTLVMSCSAVRYDDQLIAARQIIQSGSIGPVQAVTITLGGGPMEVPWFIIHGIEAMTATFGYDVACVQTAVAAGGFTVGSFQQTSAHAVQLAYRNGPLVNFTLVYERPQRQAGERLWPLDFVPPQYLSLYYNFHFFGVLDHLEISLRGKNYYQRKIGAFCTAVRDGVAPIDDRAMLENTRINLAVAESLKTGKAISPTDVEDIAPVN